MDEYKGLTEKLRYARGKFFSILAEKLRIYLETHPVEMPVQRLPEEGLSIQF